MAGPLNHTVADVIRQLIIDLGHGNEEDSEDWPTFDETEPPVTGNVIVVFDTTGRFHARSQPDGRRHSHRGFVVRIFADDKEDGGRKAEAIAIAFDENVYREIVTVSDVNGENPTTYEVHSISRPSDVLSTGFEDGGKRHTFSVNGLVGIEKL